MLKRVCVDLFKRGVGRVGGRVWIIGLCYEKTTKRSRKT